MFKVFLKKIVIVSQGNQDNFFKSKQSPRGLFFKVLNNFYDKRHERKGAKDVNHRSPFLNALLQGPRANWGSLNRGYSLSCSKNLPLSETQSRIGTFVFEQTNEIWVHYMAKTFLISYICVYFCNVRCLQHMHYIQVIRR
jgi:hypothetical protein